MSVELTSSNGKIAEGMSNGTWAAIVAMARKFEINVEWNGCHDDQQYTPQQLRDIAQRIRQIQVFADILDDLANNGGAVLS